jgi:hypothetical protein
MVELLAFSCASYTPESGVELRMVHGFVATLKSLLDPFFYLAITADRQNIQAR